MTSKITVRVKSGDVLESVFTSQERADSSLLKGLEWAQKNGGLLVLLGGAPQIAVPIYDIASVSDNRTLGDASAPAPILTERVAWRWRYADGETWHFQVEEPTLAMAPKAIKEPLYIVAELTP